MHVKLGIIPYKIYNEQEMSHNDACEPNRQIIDFFESLLLHANISYEIDKNLYVNDDIVTVIQINDKKIGLLRIVSNPGQECDVEELLDSYNLELGLMLWPSERQLKIKRIIPIGPVSFGYTRFGYGYCLSWSLYEWTQFGVRYNGKGNKILTYTDTNRNFFPTPEFPKFGTFRHKWLNVADTLRNDYVIDNGFTTPQKMFEKINDCLVAVSAPGSLPILLDRFFILMLSAGCAIISPEIVYPFPGGKLDPGIHYIKCEDDFSDVPELLKTPRNKLVQIGYNAKKFFARNLTPTPLLNYIEKAIS